MAYLYGDGIPVTTPLSVQWYMTGGTGSPYIVFPIDCSLISETTSIPIREWRQEIRFTITDCTTTADSAAVRMISNGAMTRLTEAYWTSSLGMPGTRTYCGDIIPPSARSRLAQILRDRRAPAIHSHARPMGHAPDPREVRARETLRRVLGEEKYRHFLRTGSVSVRARSGRVYRILPGHDLTEVYDRGRMVERLCIVLDGQFPATDTVLIKYLLCLNNETLFRSKANVNYPLPPRLARMTDERPILEIAREIRGQCGFALRKTG